MPSTPAAAPLPPEVLLAGTHAPANSTHSPVNARGYRSKGLMHTAGGPDCFKLLQLCKIESPQQWAEKANRRIEAKNYVNSFVADPENPGVEKQRLRCSYVHDYGRNLFSCPGCWLLPGFCICGLMHRIDTPHRLIVLCHQTEWAKSSNTGTAAALTMGGRVLLRGYKEHDDILDQEFADKSTTKAVLWPGETAVMPHELKEVADRETGGRLTLIAVDAHWSGARHVNNSLPPGTIRVKLSPQSVLAERSTSLLSPLRCYKGDQKSNGRVCTLEAIAALLYEVTKDKAQYDTMLHNLLIKVDAVLVQKQRQPQYGTVGGLQGQRAAQEAHEAALAYIQQLLAQGANIDDLGRGLLKHLKADDDD